MRVNSSAAEKFNRRRPISMIANGLGMNEVVWASPRRPDDSVLFSLLFSENWRGFAFVEVSCSNHLFFHLLGFLCFSVTTSLIAFRHWDSFQGCMQLSRSVSAKTLVRIARPPLAGGLLCVRLGGMASTSCRPCRPCRPCRSCPACRRPGPSARAFPPPSLRW